MEGAALPLHQCVAPILNTAPVDIVSHLSLSSNYVETSRLGGHGAGGAGEGSREARAAGLEDYPGASS